MVLGPAMLFCPGDRPDRFGKAAMAADAVILDLEDGVAPSDKQAARAAVAASDLDPDRTVVRVNAASTEEFARDLKAVASSGFRTIMLSKAERVADLEALAGYSVIPLCETPIGVENAFALAEQTPVIALMWGAEDLVAALGGRSSRTADGRYRDVARYARARVLVAAAAAGKQACDAVHLDIADLAGLRDEAEDGAASGFVGTACIHPSQVETVREAYRSSVEAVAWAERVLAAAAISAGVFAFEGRMVDEPVLRQARRILERRG